MMVQAIVMAKATAAEMVKATAIDCNNIKGRRNSSSDITNNNNGASNSSYMQETAAATCK